MVKVAIWATTSATAHRETEIPNLLTHCSCPAVAGHAWRAHTASKAISEKRAAMAPL